MSKKTDVANRTGVILAAGFGSRLAGTVSDTDLKPLTPVAGEPLIYRTIKSLEKAGCSKVVIVLGYAYEEIKDDLLATYGGDIPIVCVKNEHYKLSNGVSVLAAEKEIEGHFILTMADHILSDGMMEIARQHEPPEQGASLLVDYKIDTILDMDDATKVLEKDGHIQEIDKKLNNFNCIDTGVFVCTRAIIDAIDDVYQQNGDASLSHGVKFLADNNRMTVVDIEDNFWQDVDTPEMLEYAEKVIEQSTERSV